jgi:hypothetical protein
VNPPAEPEGRVPKPSLRDLIPDDLGRWDRLPKRPSLLKPLRKVSKVRAMAVLTEPACFCYPFASATLFEVNQDRMVRTLL